MVNELSSYMSLPGVSSPANNCKSLETKKDVNELLAEMMSGDLMPSLAKPKKPANNPDSFPKQKPVSKHIVKAAVGDDLLDELEQELISK